MKDLVTGTRIREEVDEMDYLERHHVLDMWTSPFRKVIVNRIDQIVKEDESRAKESQAAAEGQADQATQAEKAEQNEAQNLENSEVKTEL